MDTKRVENSLDVEGVSLDEIDNTLPMFFRLEMEDREMQKVIRDMLNIYLSYILLKFMNLFV